MKQMKRMIALLLVGLMLMSILPTAAFADYEELLTDEDIIYTINMGLDLEHYYPCVYDNEDKAPKNTICHDLSIGGTIFNDYFYYTAVQEDAPFGSSAEYAAFLIALFRQVYEEVATETDDCQEAEAAALAVVKECWDYYLYDIYDPEFQKMNDNDYYTHYTPNGMGDKGFEWPKSEQNYSSFHYYDQAEGKILPLDYHHLENGVEYDNFISGLSKTATAAAAGDANTDRQYDVQIVADAQAKVKAPVVLIFQIQTSWQLFDLAHANKLKDVGSYTDDNTEVGAVANNTDLATLYEIKRALLEFVDYMETNYPGNNLFLGFTETKHDASTKMFRNGSGVSNNEDVLEAGIIGWDIFGNCEHVHYDSDKLEDVVEDLEDDLAGLVSQDNVPIPYEDVSKAVVVIGGPTEKTNGTNGYACVLPWRTFQENKIDAVYGIRVNDGTSYVTDGDNAGIISWLDYDKNNSGAPYAYDPTISDKDKGKVSTSNFTDKFVATDRQAIVDALIAIAEEQMNAKGLDITAEDVYVEDLTVSDTISPEFEIDTSAGKQIVATLYDREGVLVDGPYVYADDPTDPAWNVQVDEDNGTTTVTYAFDQVYNGNKAVLDIPIIAKEDYIGSNNVLTNVGKPTAEYKHTPVVDDVPQPEVTYTVNSTDTPEVNVPIRYSAVDGGETTVWLGASYDLAKLDSDQIIADIMDRIDNYKQINGSVTFEWVLPDGSVAPIDGEIVVKNGTYDHDDVPYLNDEYQFTDLGIFDAYLRITFTPNDVKNNGNFSDMEVTAVEVNPRTEQGKVDIEVIFGDATVDYYVRKVWGDKEDHSGDPITYQLYAFDKPYLDENDGPVIRTLSADNEWQDKIEGLPAAVVDDNGTAKVVAYSVVELTDVEDYYTVYGTDEQIDEVWNGYLRLTLNAGDEGAIEKAKFVHVNFTYNGVTYDYDYPLYIGDKNDPANQKLAKKVDNTITLELPYNMPIHYSGNDDQYGTDCALTLPVGADGSILGNVTINEIFTYEERKYETKDEHGVKIWKQTTYRETFPKDDKTFITCEAEVVSDLISRDEVPVLVINNNPEVFYVVHHAVHVNDAEKLNEYYDDFVDIIPMYALRETDGMFDLTEPLEGYYDGIREGYIYGGMYAGVRENANHDAADTSVPANDYDTPDDNGWCGQELEPEAWNYYYLREVSEEFLQPRIVSVRRHGRDLHVERYLLTAIDKDGADKGFYSEYGFFYDPTCDAADFEEYLQFGGAYTDEDEEIYDSRVDEDTAEYPDMSSILYEYLDVYSDDVLTDTYEQTTVFSSAAGYSHITDDDYFGCLPYESEYADGGSMTARGHEFDYDFHYTPYYATADGVFVSGIYERYSDISQAETRTEAVNYNEKLESGSLTYCYHKILGMGNPFGMMVMNSFAANPNAVEEPVPDPVIEPAEVTVTIHAEDEISFAAAEPGDFTSLMEAPELDGLRFAGWYADEDFTVPADLTDVTEDTDVYARYIDETYFTVMTVNTVSKKVITKTRVVTVVDDRDNYQEVGLEITVGGEKNVYALKKDYASVNGYSPVKMFGDGVDKHSRMIYQDVKLNGVADGTEIEMVPYYITADGSRICGKSRSVIYNTTEMINIGG